MVCTYWLLQLLRYPTRYCYYVFLLLLLLLLLSGNNKQRGLSLQQNLRPPVRYRWSVSMSRATTSVPDR